MHRHPPRHGARRNISTRSRRRSATGLPRPPSATRATRRAGMGALVSCSQRDDVRKQVRKLVESGARIVAGDPDAAAGPDGGAFMQPILLRADDPWGIGRGPRCRGVRAGQHDHALPATWPTPSRSPIAAWAAWCCRYSPIRPRRRASSSRAPRPFTGGCWSSTATMPRNRPATARRSRSSSTAVPAAPAAARRWAASAGSSITCSAPRSSRPRR